MLLLGTPVFGTNPPAPHGQTTNEYVQGYSANGSVAKAQELAEKTKERAVKGAHAANAAVVDPYEYRLEIACGRRRVSAVDGSEDAGICREALNACRFRLPPSDGPLYLLWQRPRNRGAWQFANEYCRLDALPAAVPRPPAVPSLGQLQTAFRQLPFAKPSVGIQPAGNLTLVNLPTFYRASWPAGAGLRPGDVSRPVQLLSWSVEFKIASQSYDFDYGDGTRSGPVTDAGGTYPDGAIRHTYTRRADAAQVRVDARLTGQFRANGGEWMDIDTIADLQGEPVTVLQVQEAKARLVTR